MRVSWKGRPQRAGRKSKRERKRTRHLPRGREDIATGGDRRRPLSLDLACMSALAPNRGHCRREPCRACGGDHSESANGVRASAVLPRSTLARAYLPLKARSKQEQQEQYEGQVQRATVMRCWDELLARCRSLHSSRSMWRCGNGDYKRVPLRSNLSFTWIDHPFLSGAQWD